MSLSVQPMFAIVIVIFVFFVLFMVLSQRTNEAKTDQYFSGVDYHNNFFVALLTNSNCVSTGKSFNTTQVYEDIHSLIEEKKLRSLNYRNQDLWCVENYKFMYSLKITDTQTKSSWVVGLDDTSKIFSDDKAFTKIKSSLPCAIRYDGGVVHSCIASLSTYHGKIPQLYGMIKERCIAKDNAIYKLYSDYEIKYSANNLFCIGKDCFFPYFSCNVGEFTIPKGENLIYMKYEDNSVKVI
ncbi:MAG: hypothetical protein V1859_09275 [archaeon]